MQSVVKQFFLDDSGKKRNNRYTCRALFPGSVSSIHPHSMMSIVLNQFVKNNETSEDAQNTYISNKIIDDFSYNSEIKEDKSKGRLLEDWVTKDLCFNTKSGERGPYLVPLCLNVPALFPWRKQRPYHKIVAELLRVGRKDTSLDFDAPMTALKECFKAEYTDPESSILKSCLPNPEESDWKIKNVQKYSDQTLCFYQARLFQSDIQNILYWDIPRHILLQLVQRLILYHLCTYYVKMAFLLDDLVKKAKAFIRVPEAHSSTVFFCINCLETSDFSDKYVWDSSRKCQYHPKYPIQEKERSQVWHNALIKYQENVGTMKFIMHKIGVRRDKELDNKDNILSLLDDLYKKRNEARSFKPLLDELEIFNLEMPPKSQAWDFFKRYASKQKETSFATAPRRGKFGIKISPDLLSAFAHCFIHFQKTRQKPPLLREFLIYLNSRGFDSVGTNTTELENHLRSLGILKDYADMGAARELEPIFTHKDNDDV